MPKFSLNINDQTLLDAIAGSAAKHGRSLEDEALSLLSQAALRPCDSTEEALQESINELQSIHGIGLMANSSLDVQQVLQRIMEGTMAALEAPVGMIFERNTQTGSLRWMAQKGLSQDFVRSYEDKPIQPGEGLTGRIAESGQALYIRENSSADPRIARPATAAENLNTFIGVPIFAGDDVVAVMNILTFPPQILEEKAISFIESVATYVGVAIRNARIHTDYREAQKQLRLLYHAIEQSPSTVMITDMDGIIQYINPKASSHTGYAPDELISQNVNTIESCNPDVAQQQELWQTIKSGHSWRGEFCNKKKNGEPYWETASISPVTDENGITTNFIKVSEDITHLKKIQMELQEAKKLADSANEAKNRFLTNMSHELRTPLTAVMGFSNLLKHDPSLSQAQLNSLDIIEHSGEHLLMLINDLLDISRIEAGNLKLFPSELSLHDFLWDVADTFKLRIDAKGIRFTTDFSPDLPTAVIGDETKIRQILNNLIGNAIKFTNEGEVRLRVYPYQQHTRFQVEDTGIGIPQEGLEKIFQAFHQLDNQAMPPEGIGMGLAISNRLAELMGGTISVSSEQGKGSNFCFDVALPTVDADLKKQQSTQMPIINYMGPRRTILIADDAVDIRSLMTKLLTKVGFNVEQASNGQECLEKATEIQPDIILMDIVMPIVDGLEATRQIRQLSLPNRPVIIAISAKAFSEDAQQCLTVGCDDFLPKPVKLDKLLDKIAQHLNLEWDYSSKGN